MLFGHQANDNSASQVPDDMVSDTTSTDMHSNPLSVDSETGANIPATMEDNGPTMVMDTPSVDDALSDETASATPTDPEAPTSEPTPQPAPAPAPASDDTNNPLLSLKQQALNELSPLVSHLEQSPEEKFRTTMMMIQSTDNHELLNDAYAAAKAIPDEKVRAQALLDVVNEINYFTQQQKAA